MKRILLILAFLLAPLSAQAQQLILKGATVYKCQFEVIDVADHIAGKTGLTPTFTISKNGGAYAASHAATITELSLGGYLALLDATDTNTDGPILGRVAASGSNDQADFYCGQVVEFDPRGITPQIDDFWNALCSSYVTSASTGKRVCDIGAPNGASIEADIRGIRAVPKSTAFTWAKQFKTSAGVLVTTGTPSCTRALDATATASFGAGTLSATAVTTNGLSTVSFGTGDVNASNFVILKCTLATASDIYEIFKVQP